MTGPGSDLAAPTKGNGMMKWWINSMWGFWLVLLTFSLGLATAIYYVWLKGNI
jgi:hypothetical protein